MLLDCRYILNVGSGLEIAQPLQERLFKFLSPSLLQYQSLSSLQVSSQSNLLKALLQYRQCLCEPKSQILDLTSAVML